MKINLKKYILPALFLAVLLAITVARNMSYRSDVAYINSSSAPENAPKLLMFGAHWCGPCRDTLPAISDFKKQYGDDIQLGYIDIAKDPNAAEPYNIGHAIPTILFIDPKCNEIYRHTGSLTQQQIISIWQELGFELD